VQQGWHNDNNWQHWFVVQWERVFLFFS